MPSARQVTAMAKGVIGGAGDWRKFKPANGVAVFIHQKSEYHPVAPERIKSISRDLRHGQFVKWIGFLFRHSVASCLSWFVVIYAFDLGRSSRS